MPILGTHSLFSSLPFTSETLILTFYRCNRMDKALDLFKVLTSRDLAKVTSFKVSRVANSFAADKTDSKELIPGQQLFAFSNIKANSRTYNILLKGFRGADGESFNRCLDVLIDMETFGVKPDVVTINTLVDACVLTGNLERAEQVGQSCFNLNFSKL